MTAGRPTKYTDDMIEQVYKYLRTTGKEQMHIPKIESFAMFIGVHKDTLYQWKNKIDKKGRLVHQEFSDALDLIMMKQKEQLIDDGIYGGKEVNSTIVKLLLQNNHGMRERTDLTSGDKPVQSLVTLDTKPDENTNSVRSGK